MRLIALCVAAAVLAAARDWRLVLQMLKKLITKRQVPSRRQLLVQPSKAAWLSFGQDVVLWAGLVYFCEAVNIHMPKVSYVILLFLAAYRLVRIEWPDFSFDPREWMKQLSSDQEPEPPEAATPNTSPALHLVKPTLAPAPQQSDEGFSRPQFYGPGEARTPIERGNTT